MDFNPFKLLGTAIGYAADTITDAPGEFWSGIEEQWDTKNNPTSAPTAPTQPQFTKEQLEAMLANMTTSTNDKATDS